MVRTGGRLTAQAHHYRGHGQLPGQLCPLPEVGVRITGRHPHRDRFDHSPRPAQLRPDWLPGAAIRGEALRHRRHHRLAPGHPGAADGTVVRVGDSTPLVLTPRTNPTPQAPDAGGNTQDFLAMAPRKAVVTWVLMPPAPTSVVPVGWPTSACPWSPQVVGGEIRAAARKGQRPLISSRWPGWAPPSRVWGQVGRETGYPGWNQTAAPSIISGGR